MIFTTRVEKEHTRLETPHQRCTLHVKERVRARERKRGKHTPAYITDSCLVVIKYFMVHIIIFWYVF